MALPLLALDRASLVFILRTAAVGAALGLVCLVADGLIYPLLLLRRGDAVYWPIFIGSCWMLVPKNYNPEGVLSWQNFLNPLGLSIAVAIVGVHSFRRSAPLPAAA